MTGTTAQGSFGAFGKIPSLGDFLRLNLPADFVKAWDDWLQAGMVAARERLGERWDECYLSAPIWRFSLPAGAAGNRAVSGILMASVDRVGRRYPLTLAAACAGGDTALRHFANGPVFEALEEIALDILDQDRGREALAEALSPLSLDQPQTGLASGTAFAGSALPEQVLAAKQVAQLQGDAAVWTTRLEAENRMLLSRGLPDSAQVIGLFDLAAPVWQPAPRVKTA